MCFQKHFSQRAKHLPGSGGVLRIGWLAQCGEGIGEGVAAVWVSHHVSSHFRGRGGGRGREQVAPDWAGLDNSCTKTPGFGKEAARGDWQAAWRAPRSLLLGAPPAERSAPDGLGRWNPPRYQRQPFPPLSSFWLVPVSLTPMCPGGTGCPLGCRRADWQPLGLQREAQSPGPLTLRFS